MTNRTVLRIILLAAAVVCFVVAWWISAGNTDSWTNPTPWGYAGLGLFAGSFLP